MRYRRGTLGSRRLCAIVNTSSLANRKRRCKPQPAQLRAGAQNGTKCGPETTFSSVTRWVLLGCRKHNGDSGGTDAIYEPLLYCTSKASTRTVGTSGRHRAETQRGQRWSSTCAEIPVRLLPAMFTVPAKGKSMKDQASVLRRARVPVGHATVGRSTTASGRAF